MHVHVNVRPRAMCVCVARGRRRLRGPSTGLGAAPTKHAAFLVLAVRAVCEGVTDPRQDDTVPVRALHAVRTGERRARRPGHSRFGVGHPRGEQDRCRQEAAPASHAARACVHGEVGVAPAASGALAEEARGAWARAGTLPTGRRDPTPFCLWSAAAAVAMPCSAACTRAAVAARHTARCPRVPVRRPRAHARARFRGGPIGIGSCKARGHQQKCLAMQCPRTAAVAPRRGVGQRGTAATGPACVRAPRLHALAPVPCPRVD